LLLIYNQLINKETSKEINPIKIEQSGNNSGINECCEFGIVLKETEFLSPCGTFFKTPYIGLKLLRLFHAAKSSYKPMPFYIVIFLLQVQLHYNKNVNSNLLCGRKRYYRFSALPEKPND
jgi:hypothetical protein